LTGETNPPPRSVPQFPIRLSRKPHPRHRRACRGDPPRRLFRDRVGRVGL